MSATAEKPRTSAEKYVYDALRGYGVKFNELTEEQRARALAAPEAKPGLRGKSVARWIVEGESLREQASKAETERARQGAEQASANRSEAARASGRTPPKSEPKYPQPIRDAVKRANEIRGKSHGAGPKQHVAVREAVVSELVTSGGLPDAEAVPTVAQIVKLSGAKNLAHLFALAAEAPKDELKVLHPLAQKMPDDPWTKGRHLAAALAAWTDEIKGRRS